VTDLNVLAIEKFLRKDTSKLKELIEKICTISRRSRRDNVEANCYDRIAFFDNFDDLVDISIIVKVSENGMITSFWEHQKKLVLMATLKDLK
jgi:hypothetical protein